jgi:hypothetical protein
MIVNNVGIHRPRINHMKLNEHTQRLFLSPSVCIARSKLFLYFLLFSPLLQTRPRSSCIYTRANRPKLILTNYEPAWQSKPDTTRTHGPTQTSLELDLRTWPCTGPRWTRPACMLGTRCKPNYNFKISANNLSLILIPCLLCFLRSWHLADLRLV